jgi:hypothetical protein
MRSGSHDPRDGDDDAQRSIAYGRPRRAAAAIAAVALSVAAAVGSSGATGSTRRRRGRSSSSDDSESQYDDADDDDASLDGIFVSSSGDSDDEGDGDETDHDNDEDDEDIPDDEDDDTVVLHAPSEHSSRALQRIPNGTEASSGVNGNGRSHQAFVDACNHPSSPRVHRRGPGGRLQRRPRASTDRVQPNIGRVHGDDEPGRVQTRGSAMDGIAKRSANGDHGIENDAIGDSGPITRRKSGSVVPDHVSGMDRRSQRPDDDGGSDTSEHESDSISHHDGSEMVREADEEDEEEEDEEAEEDEDDDSDSETEGRVPAVPILVAPRISAESQTSIREHVANVLRRELHNRTCAARVRLCCETCYRVAHCVA